MGIVSVGVGQLWTARIVAVGSSENSMLCDNLAIILITGVTDDGRFEGTPAAVVENSEFYCGESAESGFYEIFKKSEFLWMVE